MPTNRQVCSDISDYLKANNVDDRISYRFILSELRDNAQNFIKQDADNRRIFKQSSLWKTLPCGVEFEEVSLISCIFDVAGCQLIMRSKTKIPKTYVTSYGDLIKLTNLDGSGNYIQISPSDYQSQKDRKYINKQNKYFWIIDDYIYIPDSYIEALRVTGFFKTDDYLSYGACASKNCFKPLDMEFNCPDYLIKIVKDDTKRQLLARYNIVKDENPDLNNLTKE